MTPKVTNSQASAGPERVLTQAERDAEDAKLARARVSGAMRRGRCKQCGARQFQICVTDPPADHMGRWVDAYAEGRITKSELADIIGGLRVIQATQLVSARRSA
jgi:transcription elongation factor Elf1